MHLRASFLYANVQTYMENQICAINKWLSALLGDTQWDLSGFVQHFSNLLAFVSENGWRSFYTQAPCALRPVFNLLADMTDRWCYKKGLFTTDITQSHQEATFLRLLCSYQTPEANGW